MGRGGCCTGNPSPPIGGTWRDEGHSQCESAFVSLARPKNLAAYSESSLDMAILAAAYAYGILRNHPFVDGNKRTALIIMRTFLKLNGYDLMASQEEKYLTIMQISSRQMTEEELAGWIRERLFELRNDKESK